MVALHEPRPVLERDATNRLAEEVLAFFRRGNELFDAEDFQGALREYDAAARILPNDPTILINRGAILGALGRFDEALACYDRAIALSPDDHVAFHNRGVALAQLKRFDDAVAAYDQAVQLVAHDAGTLANRGLALAHLGRHKEALASIDKALTLAGPDGVLDDCRRKIVTDLLAKLAAQGFVEWSGGKPKGSTPLIKITPGPPISDFVIQDRR